jgi:Ricin-type beta-trefoil lectin domain-like
MFRTLFLTLLIVGLAVFAIPSRVYALDSSKPCPFYEEGCEKSGSDVGYPNEGPSIPPGEGPSSPDGDDPEERHPKWARLQLKHGGQYLDAEYCSTKIGLNPGSKYEGGACQLWRLKPVGGGWSRLQLKHGGQYLDAEYCSTKIGLNPGSDYEGGACQLWRLEPAGGGWNRHQLKHGGQYLDAEYCSTKIGLNPGSKYEGGACQLWRLVPSQ